MVARKIDHIREVLPTQLAHPDLDVVSILGEHAIQRRLLLLSCIQDVPQSHKLVFFLLRSLPQIVI